MSPQSKFLTPGPGHARDTGPPPWVREETEAPTCIPRKATRKQKQGSGLLPTCPVLSGRCAREPPEALSGCLPGGRRNHSLAPSHLSGMPGCTVPRTRCPEQLRPPMSAGQMDRVCPAAIPVSQAATLGGRWPRAVQPGHCPGRGLYLRQQEWFWTECFLSLSPPGLLEVDPGPGLCQASVRH